MHLSCPGTPAVLLQVRALAVHTMQYTLALFQTKKVCVLREGSAQGAGHEVAAGECSGAGCEVRHGATRDVNVPDLWRGKCDMRLVIV